MNDEYQCMAANAIAGAAHNCQHAFQQMISEYERPCVVWKPAVFVDGDQWCALLGPDLQSGVAGFGKSPSEAMYDFDRSWSKKLP